MRVRDRVRFSRTEVAVTVPYSTGSRREAGSRSSPLRSQKMTATLMSAHASTTSLGRVRARGRVRGSGRGRGRVWGRVRGRVRVRVRGRSRVGRGGDAPQGGAIQVPPYKYSTAGTCMAGP